jgi:hypothetical protein
MVGARDQFDPLGAAYAGSTSHATGKTLQMVVERACTEPVLKAERNVPYQWCSVHVHGHTGSDEWREPRANGAANVMNTRTAFTRSDASGTVLSMRSECTAKGGLVQITQIVMTIVTTTAIGMMANTSVAQALNNKANKSIPTPAPVAGPIGPGGTLAGTATASQTGGATANSNISASPTPTPSGASVSGTSGARSGGPSTVGGVSVPGTTSTSNAASAAEPSGIPAVPVPDHNTQAVAGSIPTFPAGPIPPVTPSTGTAAGGGSAIGNFGPSGACNASVQGNNVNSGTVGFATAATTQGAGNAAAAKCAGAGQIANSTTHPGGTGGGTHTSGGPGPTVQITICIDPPFTSVGATALPGFASIGGTRAQSLMIGGNGVSQLNSALAAALNARFGAGTAFVNPAGKVVVRGPSPLAISLPGNTTTVQITCP